MMAKKPAAEGETFPRKHIPLYRAPGDSKEEEGRKLARLLTSPELAAYRIVNVCESGGLSEQTDVPTLLETLRDQATAAKDGDMGKAEAMLMNQATALQTLFARLTERALGQTFPETLELLLRLGLKAQAQCRATIESLSNIKNPPVVYARQANVTTGPQQINNGVGGPSPAREIQNPPNQLSGTTRELLPDARTSGHASGTNQTLEAVGIINRP